MSATFHITRCDTGKTIDGFTVDTEEELLCAIEARIETTLIGTNLLPADAVGLEMLMRLSLVARERRDRDDDTEARNWHIRRDERNGRHTP